MIHRCETCPFWKTPVPGDLIANNYSEAAKANGEWGVCLKAEGLDGGPKILDTFAFAVDWSSAGASLETHQSFGCLLHPMNKAIA